MPLLSNTATFLITLLNNINELIVRSSDRKSAAEVMQAFRIYIRNKNVTLSEDKIDNFFAIINDARPYTLTVLLKDIAQDIVKNDAKKKQIS